MAEPIITDTSPTGLKAIAQGQRPAEALSPLEQAQQRARGILNRYIGPPPKPNEEKELTQTKYDDLSEVVKDSALRGNFEDVTRLLRDLQSAGRLDLEEGLALLSQTAAMSAFEDVSAQRTSVNALLGREHKDLDIAIELTHGVNASHIKNTRNVIGEITSAQLALTKARHAK